VICDKDLVFFSNIRRCRTNSDGNTAYIFPLFPCSGASCRQTCLIKLVYKGDGHIQSNNSPVLKKFFRPQYKQAVESMRQPTQGEEESDIGQEQG
jgi:hypothetical protein